MKRIFPRLFFGFMMITCIHAVQGQDVSNKGKDFWIGYGNHVRMFNPGLPEKMQLHITSDVNTAGVVTISSIGFSYPFVIRANETTVVDIPRAAALLDNGLYDHGIHVTADLPIVVYSFIYVNSISGATVCLPTNTLGNDYYSVNIDQVSNEPNASSYFFVIATDTGKTTVEITPSALTKSGQPAGVSFLVTLNQGQVYQVLGSVTGNDGVDLTGSRIRTLNSGRGCKRIAVFSGSGKVAIGCAFRSSDNLYQQMYPTSTWGRKYITVPGIINSNNVFRIVKSDPSAVVSLNGTIIPDNAFVNNFYYQFSGDKPNVVESDKPILVVQYFPTQGCLGNPNPGDPEMIFLNPVEQTISQVTLNSLQPGSGTDITFHFLNVVLKNDSAAIHSFRIDGVPYTTFIAVPADTSYVYARITTTAGTHTISCEVGFNIIAYGFGNAESYGFSGGTHLKDLYQYASIKNEYAVVNYPSTCVDAPFSFNMTFPYEPTQIEWKFDGLFPDEIQTAPTADSSWTLNGRKLFLYKLKKIYKGPPAGDYPIKIIAFNPTPDGCHGVQEIDYHLTVYQKPVADFAFTSAHCPADTIFFKDITSPAPESVIRWVWDFNNGDSAWVKDPGYAFRKAGTYKVSYNYITDIGCVSSVSKSLTIYPVPVANFEITTAGCENRDIIFADKSSIESGSIIKRSWTMGDGKEWQKATGAPFADRFAKTGTYTVTMQAQSDMGCAASIAHDVKVSPNPVAGFVLPSDCTPDPLLQFTNTSSIADSSESLFTYNWRFGDPNANATNPDHSTVKDPTHRYAATGLYPVGMKVTSAGGCVDSVQQNLNLTAAAPDISFSIKQGLDICSDQEITLINNSSVAIGKIQRFEIYWDYANDPSDKLIDSQPQPAENYVKNYPVFYSPAERDRRVYVVAYSADNCLASQTQVIKVRAAPEVVFDPFSNVCANDASFQVTQARVVNGLQGTGVFAGKGISASGLFNPAVAGGGNHIIRYSYTGANQCKAFREQPITVFPISVSAGPDKYVDVGQETTLTGSATGDNLRYTWSPSASLSSSSVLQPLASPRDDIQYTLTVTSEEGCSASDNVQIKVLKAPAIPNAFSPNHDGINDRWMIQNLSTFPSATVEVYNRYGQLVFRSVGYNNPWDGTIGGKEVPVGTYYYIISPGNGRKQINGSLTLIR